MYLVQEELCLKQTNTFSDLEGGWRFTKDLNECVKGADAIVILTAWEEYKELDFSVFSQLMRKPSWLFDTRNVVSKSKLKGSGMNFWQIGVGICNYE